MKKTDFFASLKEIYFIGVGGVSMSGLAEYCVYSGKTVFGSDREKSDSVKKLQSLGAKIFIGHDGNNLKGADAVIYTSAISEDNPELIKAKELKIPIFRRTEFLSLILKDFKTVIAVSGCHGKTTTTAMISRALYSSGKEPTAFIGGNDVKFGNLVFGKKDFAVIEACEYKKNFLDIFPNIAVITNVDGDHLDSYKGKADLINCFSVFSSRAKSVVNADDGYSKLIIKDGDITFGINSDAVIKARNVRKKETGYSFLLYVRNEKKFRVNLNTPGKFNVYNALAAFAACYAVGINLYAVKSAVESFTPVERRTEYLGEFNGKKIYADYAHHPNEIKEVLTVFPKNCLIVFQPHTYSRTKYLKREFTDVLSLRDTVIYKTYPAREKYDASGDGYNLYLKLKKNSRKKVYYAKNGKSLYKTVSESAASVVAVIGAGDVYFTAKKLFIDKKS